jgi:hypothetical protein
LVADSHYAVLRREQAFTSHKQTLHQLMTITR